MKKAVSLFAVLVMLLGLIAGCGSSADKKDDASKGIDASNIKIGAIYIGDENEGYTAAHMAGIDEMAKALGIKDIDKQIIEKTGIKEDQSCYDAAADLAEQGCNIIFANSFGFEDYIKQAAQDYPKVQFCHASGAKAKESGLANMHNYFTAVYESRYVSGVVAGLKLNEMIDNGTISNGQAKLGYVGAYPYPEVISGFTSFYLGAKSVCPSVTMEVQYTNSWADMAGENEVASKLIQDGCKIISQHADTTGAPTACEKAKVPCVGYNVDMTSVAPNTALTSATINWGPYYTYAVKSVLDGTSIDTDWCKGYVDGAVGISKLNDAVVAKGTADKVAEVEKALKDGSLHVFDTKTFTIGGKTIEDLIKAGGDNAKYDAYVKDGYFHESGVISAPAFGLIIDGITANAK